MSTLYLAHFGLKEPPFTITPNPRFFYTGGARGALLEALVVAVTTEEGITAAIGEVGSGKTMLARLLVDRLTQMGWQVAYLANPAFAPNEIVAAIAHDLGIAFQPEADGNGSPITLIDRLNAALVARFRNGQRTAVVIDEAHAMSAASLDEVRRLANLETGEEKLLQIVLFGQPELAELLRKRALRPLAERIIHRFTLPPLPRPSVREYLEFRLRAAGLTGPIPFTSSAIARIGRVSGGIARRVNLLADKALLAAFARQAPRATRRDVRRAERDLTWSDLPYLYRAERWRMAAIAFALLSLAACGVALWLSWPIPLLPAAPASLLDPRGVSPSPVFPGINDPPSVATASSASRTQAPLAPSSGSSTAPAPNTETLPPNKTGPKHSSNKPQVLSQARPLVQQVRTWQRQGYTHIIELSRWPAALPLDQQQAKWLHWQHLMGNKQAMIILLASPDQDKRVFLILGPFRSSTEASQKLLELPAAVLLEMPKVIPLTALVS